MSIESDPRLTDVAALVTGGAGFIGSHLVDALVERGARVRVLDDFSTGRRRNLEPLAGRVEIQEGDVRDLETCRRACRGTAYVFHQAALGSVPRSLEDPATTVAVNVTGTANVLAAARDQGVRRVVYASSSSVYGDSEALPKREGEEGRPLSPYALSKRMGEQLAELFARGFGLEVVSLRYFNVYGPRQDPAGPYAAVIPRFFAACRRGEPPVIYGDGGQSRDFTHVADAVAANLLAAGAPPPAPGAVYNVATGRAMTILDLARRIIAVTGAAVEPVCAPPRPGDVRHSLADPTKAGRELGFMARIGIDEGLERMCSNLESGIEG